MEEDYYRILGVDKSATIDEIKKAFKTKARQYHPDKGGDPEQFKKINEAYGVLSNEEHRRQYDQFGKNGPQMPEFPDFFSMMFGGRRGAGGHRAAATQDRIIPLEITIEEAVKGTTVQFRHKRKIFVGDPEQCRDCKGQGQVVERMNTNMGFFQNIRICPRCTGMGKIFHESQFQNKIELTEIHIPPKTAMGAQHILYEKADEIPGMKTGNIIVQLKFSPHPFFEVVGGYHLLCRLKIHPLEAMTRFSREIILPTDEKIVLGHEGNHPFFSTIHQWRRIRRKGLYSTNGSQGDLFIEFLLDDFTHPNLNILYHSARMEIPHFEPDNIPLQMIETVSKDPSSASKTGHPEQVRQECHPS